MFISAPIPQSLMELDEEQGGRVGVVWWGWGGGGGRGAWTRDWTFRLRRLINPVHCHHKCPLIILSPGWLLLLGKQNKMHSSSCLRS